MTAEDRVPYPSHAIVKSLGKCRVLEYVGNNVFRVLTSRDETYRVPRERLTFIKS